MSYRQSQLDMDNLAWMNNDNTCATLHSICLKRGHLRGVYPFDVDFTYPISALAGENGSGKSTFMAIAACAFHNTKKGFRLSGRDKTYYTFSDFFIQSNGEVSPAGIHIRYQIRHNNWKSANPGLGWQSRIKKVDGRWNNYDTRVTRNVIYFGIQRIVPHYEQSACRAYRRAFSPGNTNIQVRLQIQAIAGKILGRSYSNFDVHRYSKYQLPIVDVSTLHYSGFNMGAGECAVFGILTAILEAGRGTLLVIDEIELGLHEKAQRRLVEELKKLCKKYHCQIICSTHSPVILESLPPEGRFFIESGNSETRLLTGISPEYACGKLAGRNSDELDVFVEDKVGQAILTDVLPLEGRERINVIPIGSSEAVLRQLAARYLERRDDCLAFLDGDKAGEHNTSVAHFKNYLETCTQNQCERIETWISARLKYLPGDTWPEKWLIEQVQACGNNSRLKDDWGTSLTNMRCFLGEAKSAGKHSEFYSLHENLHLPIDHIRSHLIKHLNSQQPDLFKSIIKCIDTALASMA